MAKDNKLYLVIVLLCMTALIVTVVVYYIYSLTTSYSESNIILPYNYMNTELSFNHDAIFEHDNCEMGITYLYWCYIKSWDYKYEKLKPILNKGSKLRQNYSNDELMNVTTSNPAIFLNAKKPTMIFAFGNNDNEGPYEITNIPIKKWFHIAVTVYDNMVELYMDGHLMETIYFTKSLSINYSPLHIAELGGYDGFISKLAVFASVLDSGIIQQYYLAGPGDVDLNACPSIKPNKNTQAHNTKQYTTHKITLSPSV